jgi:hypothetical protein
VDKTGERYVALGEHSDLWKGTLRKDDGQTIVVRAIFFFFWDIRRLTLDQVALKLLRGGSATNTVFLDKLKNVSLYGVNAGIELENYLGSFPSWKGLEAV